MAALVVSPEVNTASARETIPRLARSVQDIRSASAAEPSWLSQSNAVLGHNEDEFAVFEQTLYALCKASRKREAIAEALDYFDERLIARRFRDCDRAFRRLQVDKLASSVLVSILGITIRAKQLKGRAIFFDRAFQEIARQKGKRYARELLSKYR